MKIPWMLFRLMAAATLSMPSSLGIILQTHTCTVVTCTHNIAHGDSQSTTHQPHTTLSFWKLRTPLHPFLGGHETKQIQYGFTCLKKMQQMHIRVISLFKICGKCYSEISNFLHKEMLYSFNV